MPALEINYNNAALRVELGDDRSAALFINNIQRMQESLSTLPGTLRLSSSVQTASNVREQLARERWCPSRTGGPSSRRCCPYCSSRAGTNWSSGPDRRRRIRVRPGGGPGSILSYLGWPRRSSAGTATITATGVAVAVAVVAREAERGGLHRTALPPGRPRGRPVAEASRNAPPPPPQLPLLPLIRLRLRIPHRRPSRDHYPEPE